MGAIGERERELRSITDKLLEPRPGSLRATLDELRTFAVSRLTNIRSLISHPESVDQARAACAEHFGAFTLEPVTQAGKTSYLAHGKVDFFGDEAMARTGGAGGPDRTVRATEFSLPLACDYREFRPDLNQHSCGTLIADLHDARWLPCRQESESKD